MKPFDIDTREQSISYALEHGIIREGSSRVDERLVREADVVVFALYPRVFVDWINSREIK